MTILERMARIIGADTSELELAAALVSSYAKCSQRARQLSEHADLAPQENSAGALRALAQAENEQVQRLAGVMQNLGVPRPEDEVVDSPSSGTLSHWGRVVRDLEAHRHSVEEYRELAMRLAELSPAVAQ